MDKLGEKMLIVAFSLLGNIRKKRCNILIKRIMDKIVVKEAHKPVIYDYPVDNKGGKGYTYIQPITESFIAFDSWHNFRGAYLIICSCKIFWISDVVKTIKKEKYKILDIKINELSLIRDELTLGD